MEEKKTAVGNFLDRFLKDGSMGSMEHEFGTTTIIKMTVGIVVGALIVFAIKKYVFKMH